MQSLSLRQTSISKGLNYLTIMAPRNLWHMRSNFLFGSSCWMTRFSAEIIFKSVSFRLFGVKCRNAGSEPSENEDLLNNLLTMGVDVDMARKRQPGVFHRMITNEQDLKTFLLSKGASKEVIASIISRYPRAITRTPENLSERWDLWRKIVTSDLEIVNILERSPESFFRSNNNLNLENNIKFLYSVGLTRKCLCRLLTNAPRTFSNSLDLNKQMVNFLQATCLSLGHNDPTDFVRKIILKNPFILIQSTKRVKTNIEFLQSTFNLNGEELLILICGPGAEILDLSNDYARRSYTNIKKKLFSLECTEEEVQKFVLSYPDVIFLAEKKFNDKIDCLIEENVSISQIIENPRVLDSSISTLKSRIRELVNVGCNLSTLNITLLSWSKKRYEAKLKKLSRLA
ncbi:transcription termination factor 1, mitochondrial isoform X1 [Rhinopithecus roxellana]|uniref:Transcription termination factor 1, mitochondrial n=3 Tax=Rhinopithecus TaxID=542827 RepID=A0AAJ7ING0_RHIBE|nr:transcription termination factor 1, mitochondrial isoform X1 [Rhinopithecus roxellana]XP_017750440.1 PREDICTED: transcription termination factor 1, mitochondrial isoform X1 [Rhinopithecus bieti]XP_017750441.1 PREDICTED: transcription termination factor 1, mitochondrial isoform X1 [Rhinopithecus bieti]XP_017750442.1 PREDICTED: transcription termination factor 1, mitochondrial isoform X1 [Rhinopithecus bieti]XP_030788516.1 transcription termination factor 1, mitochondrial isoform X1 [Rhinopith